MVAYLVGRYTAALVVVVSVVVLVALMGVAEGAVVSWAAAMQAVVILAVAVMVMVVTAAEAPAELMEVVRAALEGQGMRCSLPCDRHPCRPPP